MQIELKKITRNKLIDSLIQIFADIFFLLFRTLARINTAKNNKVLVISLHRIGDSVFTIPSIKFLIDELKDKELFILTYLHTKEIFIDLIDPSHIITVEQNEFKFANRIASGKAKKIIKKNNPELIIDLTCTITSAFLIYNSKANMIIGTNDKYFKKIYSQFTSIRKQPHLINMYSEPVEIFLKKNINHKYFEHPVNFKKGDAILLHPFAGWAEKEWGFENYLSLLNMLKVKYKVALIFSKDESGKIDVKKLEKENIEYYKLNSIEELLNLIKNCSLFIGNDSGPLYLANYFGKPTFTIYGPTNPEYSKPFGDYHKYIRKKIECSPTYDQYCYLSAGRNCPTIDCMKMLDVSIVAEKIIEFLEELKVSNLN